MKANFFTLFSLLLVVLFCAPQLATAQSGKTARTGVSAADQEAIAALFQGVDPSKYRLQFNNKAKTLGQRSIKMADVQQVRRVTNPAEAAGYIVFIIEGDDVIYVLAIGSSKLESVLGKQKTAQLNQIMAKYNR